MNIYLTIFRSQGKNSNIITENTMIISLKNPRFRLNTEFSDVSMFRVVMETLEVYDENRPHAYVSLQPWADASPILQPLL